MEPGRGRVERNNIGGLGPTEMIRKPPPSGGGGGVSADAEHRSGGGCPAAGFEAKWVPAQS